MGFIINTIILYNNVCLFFLYNITNTMCLLYQKHQLYLVLLKLMLSTIDYN